MDELDAMFAAHRARMEIREQEQAVRVAEAEKLRARGERVLEAFVLPVLEEFREKVTAHGYRFDIEDRLRHYVGPDVEILFAPVTQHKGVQASKLAFVYSNGEIQVKREVSKCFGTKETQTSSEKWPLDKVGQEKVRTHVTAFIAAVLKAQEQ